MIILGIETSCDETAAAVLETADGKETPKFNVLSNVVSSQVELHAQYGGVVPNLAAREHTKNIIPVLKKALNEAKTKRDNIDLIAVTRGPGLIPALLVGTSAAKAIAYGWKKPIVGVNHIEGHIYANWIENPNMQFPILALIVSGGHTELVLMRNHGNFEIIGKTRDDATGEAFDKTARLLNLGYPGGPAISKAAEQGMPGIYNLPRPMINSDNLDFSFSGIKTAVRELINNIKTKNNGDISSNGINNIAAEFQQAAIDVLIYKTIKAIGRFNPKTILLAGGVAANKQLREQLGKAIKSQSSDIEYLTPNIKFCADNAAMIAAAGYFRRKEAVKNPWEIETDANIQIA